MGCVAKVARDGSQRRAIENDHAGRGDVEQTGLIEQRRNAGQLVQQT